MPHVVRWSSRECPHHRGGERIVLFGGDRPQVQAQAIIDNAANDRIGGRAKSSLHVTRVAVEGERRRVESRGGKRAATDRCFAGDYFARYAGVTNGCRNS